ncbi:hypothetical protein D3C71_1622760 [compost metagenome]
MGHNAQFDLRIVGRNDAVTLRSNKGLADPAPFVVTHRDILQVRIARGETSSSRHRLMIRGMHPATDRIDHQRQLVGVGRLQLRQATVFQDHLRQRVIQRQFGQHFFVSRWGTTRCFLQYRQLLLFVEDRLQLFG